MKHSIAPKKGEGHYRLRMSISIYYKEAKFKWKEMFHIIRTKRCYQTNIQQN